MSLKDKIQKDFIEAFRGKDETRSSVLKMLQAAVKNAEIEKKTELAKKEEPFKGLSDEEIAQIASKEAKKRKDAIEAFEKGGRAEQAEKERRELEILSAYSPEQMPEEEIRELAKKAIEETGAAGPKDIGKVMAILSPQTKGRADGALVSRIVKESLASA